MDIATLRRASRLSQGDVARLVGVTASTVYRWEVGEVAPTRRHARRLARLLGVEPDALTGNPLSRALASVWSAAGQVAGERVGTL